MLEWMFAYIQVQDSCKISYVLQEFLVQAKFLQEAYHIITTSAFLKHVQGFLHRWTIFLM